MGPSNSNPASSCLGSCTAWPLKFISWEPQTNNKFFWQDDVQHFDFVLLLQATAVASGAGTCTASATASAFAEAIGNQCTASAVASAAASCLVSTSFSIATASAFAKAFAEASSQTTFCNVAPVFAQTTATAIAAASASAGGSSASASAQAAATVSANAFGILQQVAVLPGADLCCLGQALANELLALSAANSPQFLPTAAAITSIIFGLDPSLNELAICFVTTFASGFGNSCSPLVAVFALAFAEASSLGTTANFASVFSQATAAATASSFTTLATCLSIPVTPGQALAPSVVSSALAQASATATASSG
eukprot:jgi/Astpho2/7993/fgenesh1_pg.00119_%23_27_t